jgi:hypothetical protein
VEEMKDEEKPYLQSSTTGEDLERDGMIRETIEERK